MSKTIEIPKHTIDQSEFGTKIAVKMIVITEIGKMEIADSFNFFKNNVFILDRIATNSKNVKEKRTT